MSIFFFISLLAAAGCWMWLFFAAVDLSITLSRAAICCCRVSVESLPYQFSCRIGKGQGHAKICCLMWLLSLLWLSFRWLILNQLIDDYLPIRLLSRAAFCCCRIYVESLPYQVDWRIGKGRKNIVACGLYCLFIVLADGMRILSLLVLVLARMEKNGERRKNLRRRYQPKCHEIDLCIDNSMTSFDTLAVVIVAIENLVWF